MYLHQNLVGHQRCSIASGPRNPQPQSSAAAAAKFSEARSIWRQRLYGCCSSGPGRPEPRPLAPLFSTALSIPSPDAPEASSRPVYTCGRRPPSSGGTSPTLPSTCRLSTPAFPLPSSPDSSAPARQPF